MHRASTLQVLMMLPAIVCGEAAEGDAPVGDALGRLHLPLDKETALIQCDNMTLWGRAVPSGLQGEKVQYFDQYRIVAGETELVKVGLPDVEALIPGAKDGNNMVTQAASAILASIAGSSSGPTLSTAATTRRSSVTATVSSTTKTAHKTEASRAPLSTLQVSVAGNALDRTMVEIEAEKYLSADTVEITGPVRVRVDREQGKIGLGKVDAVNVDSKSIAVTMRAVAALVFKSEVDQVRHMHLDLSFKHIDISDTGCRGLLPEMWGVRDMTDNTENMMTYWG